MVQELKIANDKKNNDDDPQTHEPVNISIFENQPQPQSQFSSCLSEDVRQTLEVSWPLVASYILINAKDFIGPRILYVQHGNDATSAFSLISPSQYLVLYTLHGPLYMISAFVSRTAGNRYEAGTVLHQSWLLGTLLSFPAMGLLLGAGSFLHAVGQPESLTHIASQYFNGYVIAIPAIALNTCNLQFLAAIKKQKTVLAFSTFSLVADIFFKYSLVLGKFGMPEMGSIGLGYATAAQSWISHAAFISYLYLKDREYIRNDDDKFAYYHFFKSRFCENLHVLKKIFKDGAPISLHIIGRFSSSLLTSIMIGWLGKLPLAINQTVAEYLYLTSPFRMGIGDASEVLVGQRVGYGDIEKARLRGNLSLAFGVGCALIAGTIFVSCPHQLASVFMHVDEESEATVRNMFIAAAAFQVMDSIRDIAFHALRGVYYTKYPAIASVFCSLFLGLPLSYAAYEMDMGVLGITIATGLGITSNAGIVYKQWQNNSKTLPVAPQPELENTAHSNRAGVKICQAIYGWCGFWKGTVRRQQNVEICDLLGQPSVSTDFSVEEPAHPNPPRNTTISSSEGQLLLSSQNTNAKIISSSSEEDEITEPTPSPMTFWGGDRKSSPAANPANHETNNQSSKTICAIL